MGRFAPVWLCKIHFIKVCGGGGRAECFSFEQALQLQAGLFGKKAFEKSVVVGLRAECFDQGLRFGGVEKTIVGEVAAPKPRA